MFFVFAWWSWCVYVFFFLLVFLSLISSYKIMRIAHSQKMPWSRRNDEVSRPIERKKKLLVTREKRMNEWKENENGFHLFIYVIFTFSFATIAIVCCCFFFSFHNAFVSHKLPFVFCTKLRICTLRSFCH